MAVNSYVLLFRPVQELRHSAELRGQEMPGGARGGSQFQDIQLLLWL